MLEEIVRRIGKAKNGIGIDSITENCIENIKEDKGHYLLDYGFMSGMLWGLTACGLITDDERKKAIEETEKLHEIKFSKKKIILKAGRAGVHPRPKLMISDTSIQIFDLLILRRRQGNITVRLRPVYPLHNVYPAHQGIIYFCVPDQFIAP